MDGSLSRKKAGSSRSLPIFLPPRPRCFMTCGRMCIIFGTAGCWDSNCTPTFPRFPLCTSYTPMIKTLIIHKCHGGERPTLLPILAQHLQDQPQTDVSRVAGCLGWRPPLAAVFQQGLNRSWSKGGDNSFPATRLGHLMFGADGALYVSAGDGASFTFADYGQTGTPLNPLGDPPVGIGGVQIPPTAEGGRPDHRVFVGSMGRPS